MANKKSNLGRIVGRTNGLHIRQKNSVDGKTQNVVSTQYDIYQGKKLRESGFNSKESALSKANTLNVTPRKKKANAQ